MQENSENITINNQDTIIKTDVGAKDGQDKCPKCGATDITLRPKTGKLICNYCRFEFEPEKLEGMQSDISQLKGRIVGSGATNIAHDTNDVITLKCTSCGAEVVIDTASSGSARCHWCRNVLSINQQIPNGSIPDVVLPFNINKDEAKTQIETFVGKRKFFAHPKFKQEFTTDNIMGVYFPYMLVDINGHADMKGMGEHLLKSYYRGNGDSQKQYYDAEAYKVERDFDIAISGLSIESSLDKLDVNSKEKTTNIINSIMPFDVENCVKYNANYLRGFTSERRDTNIEQLQNIVYEQAKDVTRFAANDTLEYYDRGVAWDSENFSVLGEQWKAAYLPVWLYSYQQVEKDKKILHYVAVNARTKETMGSVPIHVPKLVLISFLVEILGLIAMLLVDWDYSWIFLSAGIIYFIVIYSKYRNSSARHTYEQETKRDISNLNKVDIMIETRRGLSNSMINGCNNMRVNGTNINDKLSVNNVKNAALNAVIDNNSLAGFIKNNIEKSDKK